MIKNMDYPKGATPLEAEELEGLKFSHITTRGELDHLEQANISAGLMWLKRRKDNSILNEQFILKLHTQLFGDVWRWAGSFRHTEKNIGIDPVQISVQLRMLLDDVQFWLDNKTFDPIETAVRLHHRLVYIHLFPNGNGRHARIMADALLEKVYGIAPIDWLAGSDLLQESERRDNYISALQLADRGDYQALLAFVGRG
ncbi:MAG: mobile mystery protein B [Methylophaga sp.]|nr:mobile mystery protein B [Methylophaga sp.]